MRRALAGLLLLCLLPSVGMALDIHFGFGMSGAGGASNTPNTTLAGQLLYSNATPAWALLAPGADGLCLVMATGLPGWGACATGSTGISAATANGAMYATSATSGTSTAALTNGQLLMGRTGLTPVAASITATSPLTMTPGSGSITVACATCTTNAVVLTANALVLGGGGQATAVLGSLGTTTTVLHGNAGGAPSFGAVVLTADVSGVLPNGNTTAASANTASAIVARDGSGNFTAGTITASLTGTASIAATGDSATAFFTTGQLEAARGGTGADASAATGVAHVASGTWTFAPVVTADITDANVTLAKLASIATASFLGRTTAGTGVPEVLTAAQARTILGSGATYVKTFTTGDGTTITISGATHGLGTADLTFTCWDASSPRNWMSPNTVTVDSSTFEIVITVNVAQNGRCVFHS